MAWKDTEYSTYNGPSGAAYTGERDLWTGGARIFVDLSESERKERDEYWDVVMGFAGKMQGGGADG